MQLPPAGSQRSDQRPFRAVRLARRSLNLAAGIEDRVNGGLVRVANASMAVRLAELMNDEADGLPLPARGTQHTPTRFQVAHDAAAPTSTASVLYVHGSSVRIVALTDSDQHARQIARLLAYIDYPMDTRRWFAGLFPLAAAHDFGDELDKLPLPSGTSPRPESRRYRNRYLGLALWSWLPLLALAVLAIEIVGWPVVAAIAASTVAVTFLIHRTLRQ